MNEFDEETARISQVLRDTTSHLEVPTVGVSAVRRHGSVRQRRRRAGIATISAVALFGGGVLTVQRLSHNPTPTTRPAATPSTDSQLTPASIDTVPAMPVSDPATTGEPVQRVDSAFVWNAVEPGTAEAVSNQPWGTGSSQQAPYFAWSTAPGPSVEGEYQLVLYRSDDGIRWHPAADGTFTEPAVSRRGFVADNNVLFAFGTAAATAAIPQGGAGDAVVDVSRDNGASWQTQVLPLDLRGLAAMDGVGGVGLSGSLAAANGIVVAIAQPSVWWKETNTGNMVITADGAYEITNPECGAGCSTTATTIVLDGSTVSTAPPDTGPAVPASTNPPALTPPTVGTTASGDTAPAETAPALTVPLTTGPQNVDDTIPTLSGLIPFDELGIDPASVAAARTPRVFVSTNGADFTESPFPALPNSVVANGGDVRVFTAGGAFYVTVSVSNFDPTVSGGWGGGRSLIYRSLDGVSWSAVGDLADRELLGVMGDGTLVARGYADGSTNIATSTDGENWQVHDLRPLIDPTDGKIVSVDLWVVSVDEQGITVVGGMTNDPIAEAGGRSIERDGVRLEMASSRSGDPVAVDVATGEVIPQTMWSWNDNGVLSVLDATGATRATFTTDDQNQLQGDGTGQTTTKVLLHSDDAVNWSRENLADLTGSPEVGPGSIHTQGGKVLVTLIDPTRRTNDVPTTIVLVGTRK